MIYWIKQALRNTFQWSLLFPMEQNLFINQKFKRKLKKDNVHNDEYKIYLNTEQIFKGYSTII